MENTPEVSVKNENDNEDEIKSITVQVYGHVQGVFFRAWAKEKAENLNIKGWVRNRVNHHVEIHLEGLSEDVDFMVRLLKRGSPSSKVEGIIVDEIPFIGFTTFEIKETV